MQTHINIKYFKVSLNLCPYLLGMVSEVFRGVHMMSGICFKIPR